MSILDLFAKSPFKPMQEHMDVVLACAKQLQPLFEALLQDDQPGVKEVHRDIDELESEADRLKNRLRAHLPKRLLLPVDRRDLLEILDLQDSVADTVQDIADLLVQRRMELPESMRDRLMELAVAVERTCEKAAEAIHSLDELVEMGFRGREAARVERMIEELCSLEGTTDRYEQDLVKTLFQLEDTMSAVSVMLWYQIIIWIAGVADCAEKIGNRLRLLIAR